MSSPDFPEIVVTTSPEPPIEQKLNRIIELLELTLYETQSMRLRGCGCGR